MQMKEKQNKETPEERMTRILYRQILINRRLKWSWLKEKKEQNSSALLDGSVWNRRNRLLTCEHSQEPRNGIKLCGEKKKKKRKDMLAHFWRCNKCSFQQEGKERKNKLENTREKLCFRNVAHLGFLLWGLKKEKTQKLCLRSNCWVWFLHNEEKVNDGAHYTSLIAQPSLSL